MTKHSIFYAFCLSILSPSVFAATVDAHYFRDYGNLYPANTFTDQPVVNSTQGITQLAIDLSGAPSASLLNASDFSFHIGNSSDPASWAELTTSPVIQVAAGAGIGGSDRVIFDWSGGITDTWIEVTTLPTANSGLTSPDYFYAGSLRGDASQDLQRTSIDALLIINSINSAGGAYPATANDPLDINRDGFISAIDSLSVINMLNDPTLTTQLTEFTPREVLSVPLPPAIWLFMSGVLAFSLMAGRPRPFVSRYV